MKKIGFPSLKLKGSLAAWMLLIGILAPLLSLIQPTYAPVPWWNDSWSFRKQLVLYHNFSRTDLIGFPILVDITDSDLKNKAQFDGDDIVFTDTGNNTLPHEIELYDSNTGHLIAWVRIPLVSATTDTEIYVYYGNPDAMNQQNRTAVWDVNYIAVQHFEELTGTRYDSTIHSNNAALSGTVAKATAGKVDGADSFNSNGYERIQQGFLPTSAITLEFWFKPASYSPTIWTKFLNTGPTTTGGISGGQSSKVADKWYVSFHWNSGAKAFSTGDIVSGYTWNSMVVAWNGTHCQAYRNGLKIKESSISGIPDWSGKPLYLGSNYLGSEGFKGAIDEVRVSNVSRSGDWIQACYNTQTNPSSFYFIGVEETSSYSPLIFENPSNEATDVYTNPILSVRSIDPNRRNMSITFKQRIEDNWITFKTYENAPDGTYTAIPTEMHNLSTTYYWNVYATDGQSSTNKTFTLTTTDKVLEQKWMITGAPRGVSGALAADINNDGVDEVLHAGKSGVIALNGTNGNRLWNITDSNIGDHAQAQMADLNNDGILEIIVPLETPAGILALHANDGSTYWRATGLGKETYSGPVIFDIDGNGYPTIFVGSTDTSKGLNGTGRLTSLSYDGRVLLNKTFIWRPCSGGLSIADTNLDGEFEIYMGERNMYLNDPIYGDNDYGKGVLSFWARNLTLRWSRPEVFCSSQKPMIADVNNDGTLDIIIGDLNGGVAVLNSTDGSTIRMTLGIPGDAPTHYQPSIYDIDRDGNLEMIMADFHNTTSDDLVIWDLVKWKVDARMYIGKCFYGPQLADVNGDGYMEIIACNYKSIFIIDNSYHILDGIVGLSGEVGSGEEVRNIDGLSGLAGTLNYAVVQDVDGDAYNELIVTTQSGAIYAFDTPARRPNPRPRTEVQFYSEFRRGAAEYVQPQGGPTPLITSPSPPNFATDMPLSPFELQFTLTDYQHDPMNYTVTTNPNIGSDSKINVANGRYSLLIDNLSLSTTYTWTVTATDGTHTGNATYTFTTKFISPWWKGDWTYRKAITIDHTKVSGNPSNIPVLIDITDSNLANKAQTDGDDIAFTDANAVKLSHEMELYNSTNGHLIAWVNVPQLSSTTDTTIFMYYGYSSAPSQQNRTAVWDSNFVMVQHFEELSGTRFDSTNYGNNAVPSGTVTKASPGKIDGADLFNTNVYERIQQGFLPTSAITIELWLKPTSYSTTTWTKFINTGPTTTSGISGGQTSKTADSWSMGLSWNSATKSFNIGSFASSYTWNHIVITWDGSYCYAYRNGAKIKEGAMTGTPDWQGKPLYLASNYVNSEFFRGAIDEARVSNIARSAAWVQTSYNSQKDPSLFYTVGSEETTPQEPAVFTPSPADKATNVPLSLSELSFNLTDPQGDPMNYVVSTNPDIGSGSGTNVINGRYAVALSDLSYSTTYKWHVSVTDGTHWTNMTYTFTTLPSEQPTQDDPILTINGGNLVCYNQSTYDPDDSKVTNTYHWFRNGTSTTNLQLPFNTNSSTTTKDYSGYNNNGIIVRGAQWTSNGKVGGAYQFNRGLIQVPGTSSLDGGGSWSELTVEHWIYLTASQSNTRTIARIPSYEIGISGNKLFASIWVVTGSPMMSGHNKLSSNTTLQLNTWYHVVLTYKSGVALTLYINGVQDASKTLITGNIQPSGSNPLYIGWFDYFKGMIDEVTIYPKSLSPQQVYQHFLDSKDGLSSSSTNAAQETKTGETWRCEVTPNDSHQDGATKASNTITIGINNPPTAKNLKITPTTPKTNDNLTAGYTYFDPESNPESGTEIRWYKNGILQPLLNDTLTVSASLTGEGETWFFTVKPRDGTTFGDLKTSPTVTIQNTPP